MDEKTDPLGRQRFGPFEMHRGVVRRGATVLRIPPKEMAVLGALVAAGGGIVGRTELIEAGWGRGSASDASLARCIHSLRRILECEDGSEIVQTMHGHGFRLAVPVERGASGADSSNAATLRAGWQTSSQTAFERCLQSVELMGHRVPSNLQLARRALLEAVALDPTYVGAWCRLADLEILLGFLGQGSSAREPAGNARDAIDRALGYDREHPLALMLDAFVEGALEGRPVRLDAFDAAATTIAGTPGWRSKRAWLLAGAGELDLALADLELALRLAPLDQSTIFAHGYILLCAGRAEDAVRYLRGVTEEYPMADGAWLALAYVTGWLGYRAEAIQAGSYAAEIANGFPTVATGLAYALARAGDFQAASLVLRDMKHRADMHVSPTLLAAVHVAMGDIRTAVSLLDDAEATWCPYRGVARFDPRLAAAWTTTLQREPRNLALA
ncbi:MAG: winged helix-turn-helix domain-containing protein [Pseudomonadota bacterium]